MRINEPRRRGYIDKSMPMRTELGPLHAAAGSEDKLKLDAGAPARPNADGKVKEGGERCAWLRAPGGGTIVHICDERSTCHRLWGL